MTSERTRRLAIRAAFAIPGLLLAAGAAAQLSVRSDDPLGLAIREPRVRVIHSRDAGVGGTSMHLQQADPWLAYQRGRSYFFHEWGTEDGGFKFLPRRPAAASTTSCGMCHNLPFPSPGAGGNIAADMHVGRNTPHLFGAGLLETIGMQIRAQVIAQLDTNRNGYLDVPAETEGRRMVVEAAPGVPVDFGSFDDANGDGRPDLNPIVMVRYVEATGRRALHNSKGMYASLKDPGMTGIDIAVGTFASSAGDHMFPSLRLFAAGVLNNIMGILPDVATTPPYPGGRGNWLLDWGKHSNAGAFQTELALTSNPADDKDPGRPGKISEGELDLFEWFMMNYPAPGLGAQDERTQRGRVLLASLGCNSCHVASWVIQPADAERGLSGDRRFFDLQVSHNPASNRMEGKLRPLTRQVPGPQGTMLSVPAGGGFTVENVYTDLRHHNLGDRFWDYVYRGGKLMSVQRFRTPPLWGVGSTAPYGHDGQSLTLDDVIRRHGGEAGDAATAYAAAPEADREAVVAFLASLVLYQPETLPTDLDGDGSIAASYRAGGLDLGPERFWPELLFRTPPRFRGWVDGVDGDRFYSFALLNVSEAYGEELPALADRNRDTLPDLLAAPSPTAPAAPAPAATAAPAGGR
jgi:Di-haem oxidoreductase, putative peroxidase